LRLSWLGIFWAMKFIQCSRENLSRVLQQNKASVLLYQIFFIFFQDFRLTR
jgi:hypothetical protein